MSNFLVEGRHFSRLDHAVEFAARLARATRHEIKVIRRVDGAVVRRFNAPKRVYADA